MRLAGFCEKRLEVLGDDLVERRGFGLVPLVLFGRDKRWPLARRLLSHQNTISEPRASTARPKQALTPADRRLRVKIVR